MKLVVSKGAMADFHRLRVFLAGNQPKAAVRAVTTLREAIRSLEVFPGRGRPSGIPGMRELVVPFGRYAYVIRYAYLPQRIVGRWVAVRAVCDGVGGAGGRNRGK